MRRPKHTTSKARTEAALFRCMVRRIFSNMLTEMRRRVQAERDRYQRDSENCLNGIAPFPRFPFA
jgi:hypothetical protein